MARRTTIRDALLFLGLSSVALAYEPPPAATCSDALLASLNALARAGATQGYRTAPVGAEGVIVDTNLMIALARVGHGRGDADEKRWMATLRSMLPGGARTADPSPVWVSDVSTKEFDSRTTGAAAPRDLRRIQLEINRQSVRYRDILVQLEAAAVGTAKGKADQLIVADAFFARTSAPRNPPRFLTADRAIYTNLCRLSPSCAEAQRAGALLTRFATGFPVTLRDTKNGIHTLWVIPIK